MGSNSSMSHFTSIRMLPFTPFGQIYRMVPRYIVDWSIAPLSAKIAETLCCIERKSQCYVLYNNSYPPNSFRPCFALHLLHHHHHHHNHNVLSISSYSETTNVYYLKYLKIDSTQTSEGFVLNAMHTLTTE